IAPDTAYIGYFVRQFAIAENTILWQITANIQPLCQRRHINGARRRRHTQQRAGFGIKVAELQKIGRILLWQYRHIGLDKTRRKTGGITAEFAAATLLT